MGLLYNAPEPTRGKADPEDRATGRRESGGCAPSSGRGQSLRRGPGSEAAQKLEYYSAFCVIVKASSWISKCKNHCITDNLMSLKLRTRNHSNHVFCRWIYFHLRSEMFFWPSYGGRGRGRSPPPPTKDPALRRY